MPQSKPPAAPAWIEVILLAPAPQAEAAADFLVTLTGLGVEVDDFSDPPGPVQVKGFLPAGGDLAAQKAMLSRYARELSEQAGAEVVVSFQDLASEDWGQNWKKHFKPRAVTRGLMVAPPWEKAEPGPGQKVVVIDPGQAFGTGQHESTTLCLARLERLAERDLLPPRLLDVGCGTGILALAFLLFGGRTALAIDLDPEAVAASLHNAALNGLEGRLEVSATPLEEISERFPLIVANLTAKDLTDLAPALATRLAPGGEMIVSGLLVMQIQAVRAALEAVGLALLEQDSLAGWACLVMG
ncbi:MAG: 50S ribosomal protein L11 methyltransferase [Desulfarculus sp.]|nr:50S ribosomal protein L11 methyltransferase [Desulfarculus sp.]